jgi:hypothetical protein
MTAISMLQGVEEERFQRVPDGWIFSNWTPWVVGPDGAIASARCRRHQSLYAHDHRVSILALISAEILILLRLPSLRHAHTSGRCLC